MKPYTSMAAMFIAVALSSRCNAQFAAPSSIAPSLIQYSMPQPAEPGYFVSRLVLYNSDQTYVEINSYFTSPLGNGTYATYSGTYTYSIDSQNSSHATIVYDGGSGSLSDDNLYFTAVDVGTQTAPVKGPYAGVGPPVFSLSPLQTTNGGGNLSNRCQLGSGAVEISGFVIQSTGARWVLLRAVGNTLKDFGVSGTIPSPAFTLFDSSQTAVGASSVWSSDPNLTRGYSTLFSLVGAFPLTPGSDEGVLLAHLNPGAYTGVFRGGSAGTILCEVYVLPF
jgi:hypothetical protein